MSNDLQKIPHLQKQILQEDPGAFVKVDINGGVYRGVYIFTSRMIKIPRLIWKHKKGVCCFQYDGMELNKCTEHGTLLQLAMEDANHHIHLCGIGHCIGRESHHGHEQFFQLLKSAHDYHDNFSDEHGITENQQTSFLSKIYLVSDAMKGIQQAIKENYDGLIIYKMNVIIKYIYMNISRSKGVMHYPLPDWKTW